MMNVISFLLECKNTLLAIKLNAEQQPANFISQKKGYCHHLMSKLLMIQWQ